MNSIVFENVCKSYGDAKIVKSLNLEIKEGERLILLGPSGCGKTTTLRMIAGLEDITSGQLKMGGRVVNDIAPGERNIAMVFQSYALFPHLSVWDNITFGLHIQKLPEAEIKKRVDENDRIHNKNYKVFNEKIETIGTALPFDNFFAKETLFLRGDKSDYILDSDFETIYHHFPKAKQHLCVLLNEKLNQIQCRIV